MADVELVGNALCLDFVNTVNDRPVARYDWLATPAEADTWARAVGLPLDDPEDVTELARAREAREAMFRVFEAVARGGEPPRADLGTIAALNAEGLARAHLVPDGHRYRFAWDGPRTVRVLLWQVAASAAELLTHGPLERVGGCPTCTWLFLDTSRNGRRRWCSMTTCGSRDKSRRYYARASSLPER